MLIFCAVNLGLVSLNLLQIMCQDGLEKSCESRGKKEIIENCRKLEMLKSFSNAELLQCSTLINQ